MDSRVRGNDTVDNCAAGNRAGSAAFWLAGSPPMKLFRCDHCGNVLYFENTVCENCGHALGYWHATNMLVSLEPQDGHFTAPILPDQKFVYCINAQHGAC